VTRLNDVRNIDKFFGNGATGDEAGLVRMNQKWDKLPKAKSEAFGVNFEAAVLKRDGPEIARSVSPTFFWKEHDVRFVDGRRTISRAWKF
jgi:hypothetical protein